MKKVHVLYYNDPPNPFQILGVFESATEAGYAKQKLFNELQKEYKRKFDTALRELAELEVAGYQDRVQVLRERESERVIEYGKSLDIVEVPLNDFKQVYKLPDF